jgi:hypothetical protein
MFKSLDFEIKSMKQFQNPFSYSVFDFGLAQPKRPDYFSLFFLFSRSSGPIASGPSTPVGPLASHCPSSSSSIQATVAIVCTARRLASHVSPIPLPAAATPPLPIYSRYGAHPTHRLLKWSVP